MIVDVVEEYKGHTPMMSQPGRKYKGHTPMMPQPGRSSPTCPSGTKKQCGENVLDFRFQLNFNLTQLASTTSPAHLQSPALCYAP
jgi:hypothetical protein